jgi:D-alanyl-lipoteichoic acid acyltransferase DltB (MBOAT superfamily)
MAVLLWLWFYASFSAWSDLAIGAARLCGRTVPENFDRPWRAADPSDFWRRWHVSFGCWLRDYVYVPLGGSRRGRARNVALTFLVSACWHVWGTLKLLGPGYYPPLAWTGLLLWGALHAAAVIAVPRLRRRPGTWSARTLWLGTVAFLALA